MNATSFPLFDHPWPLIGVVHLPALPGSPFHKLPMEEIRTHALNDASALAEAGFNGIIVENFGDHPFLAGGVEPHTVAAMTLLVAEIKSQLERMSHPRRPIGVNVLRNDARAAMAIAAVTGVEFIRVNVHTGAMVCDQGLIEGKAYETLNYRRNLDARVAVLADVMVKHAHPLGPVSLESMARDTYLRGGAAALIISGEGTGEPIDPEQAMRVRRAIPEAPTLIGSGLTLENMELACSCTSGAIVGSALKREGRVDRPIDIARARAMIELRDQLIAESH